MYRGFNLKNLKEADFGLYVEEGRHLHDSNKKIVNTSLDSIINDDGSIYASKVTQNWFPKINADVFISHSHKDSKLAIGLAGWLKKEFGLVAFIDSCVWGYSGQLLKRLDKKYCWQPDKGTYNYETRNKTTSHVNMILSTALINMINSCECVMFLNTPESISCEGFNTEDGTESPWIYSELVATKLIEKTPRRKLIAKALESRTFDSSIPIKYDADLSHLMDINKSDLDTWNRRNTSKGATSLDSLYELCI